VTDANALANSFLMPRGYTLVFSGWDASAGTSTANFNSMINLPVAKNPDGSSITGPYYEYIVMGNGTTQQYELFYKAATLDKSKAVLTTRKLLNDQPQVIPSSGWEYVDETHIRLLPAGTAFKQADIYEFSYTAKDPTVNGVGFAAIRDFMAFLRFTAADDSGNANPMAGDIARVYTEISSQPGRMFNDFRNPGLQPGGDRAESVRRPHAMDRGRRRHQHEPALLQPGAHRAQPPGPPLRGRRVPVRERAHHRPHHGQDGGPLRQVHAEQHLPVRGRDLVGQRVLGEGGLAVPYQY
jgi:hypothetical protein